MLISKLLEENPKYCEDLLLDYQALYEGGKLFRERIANFLVKRPLESDFTYDARKNEAVYRSYLGVIIDYFSSLLFSNQLNWKTVNDNGEEVNEPDWLPEFNSNADGNNTDLKDLLRLALTQAMIKRKSWLVLEYPENYGQATNQLEAELTKANDVKVKLIKSENMIDWEVDERGVLIWAISHETSCPRLTPEDDRSKILHTWKVYTKDTIKIFKAISDEDKPLNQDLSIKPVQEIIHNLNQVPVVCLDVGKGLWIANRIASPQLEHFRLSSANNWSMRITCYAEPIFKAENPEDFKVSLGPSSYMVIGINEDASYLAPPSQHFDVVANEVKSQKDEIFRLVTQMSLNIDNTASSVRRSGESKLADAESIKAILGVYGKKISETTEKILNLISLAKTNIDTKWTVTGLDIFETIPLELLLNSIEQALSINIPSDTFRKEVMKSAANAILPSMTHETKELVNKEIDESTHEPSIDEVIHNATKKLNSKYIMPPAAKPI